MYKGYACNITIAAIPGVPGSAVSVALMFGGVRNIEHIRLLRETLREVYVAAMR
jgi:hypothetical protein